MIHVGIAGWDYADWLGPVYPAGASRGFDRLDWIARFVDVVEINSSFYRPTSPRSAESWLRRTARHAEFRFTAKAHRSCTHERGADPRSAARASVRGLAPLRDAGRFGALLLQFPWSFRHDAGALSYLERLVSALEGWPLALEVRHRSWIADDVAGFLRERGVAWCAADQPRAGPEMLPVLARVTSRLGYLRLHGRNATDWFRPDAGRDARYDYLYDDAELEDLARSAREIEAATAETYVVQNNHFRGQALVNALEWKHRLSGTRPLAPPGLVAAYPRLRACVRVEQPPLFDGASAES